MIPLVTGTGTRCCAPDVYKRQGEIREQAYVCYMTGAGSSLRVPALVFDMSQFCRMDRRQARAGEGPVSYTHLTGPGTGCAIRCSTNSTITRPGSRTTICAWDADGVWTVSYTHLLGKQGMAFIRFLKVGGHRGQKLVGGDSDTYRESQFLFDAFPNFIGHLQGAAKATTENPYFYIYSAVLSRSTVFELSLIHI